MILLRKTILTATLFIYFTANTTAQHISNVQGFPSAEPGYELGVSACYAGFIGDRLVMAGGCNFPTPGNKTYYSGIYAATVDRDTLNWQLVGSLPETAAYGTTVAIGDSLLFIGGCNNSHSLATVYSIRLDGTDGMAVVTRLADMPFTVDNAAACIAGNNIYVVGGNQNGQPSGNVLIKDMDHTAWRVGSTVPHGPCVQPICATVGDELFVWGGFHANGTDSHVNTIGAAYSLNTKSWRTLEAPTSSSGKMTLTGGVSWTHGDTIYATGGVNKDIFLDAISQRYERVDKNKYLDQPINWYKFSGNLYRYDTKHGKWLRTTFADKRLARAGAAAVSTTKGMYYIGGELKPAVRTPQIVLLEY